MISCNIHRRVSQAFFAGLWIMCLLMFLFLVPVMVGLFALALGIGGLILRAVYHLANRKGVKRA